MLLPFDFAVIDVKEAEQLIEFIEKTTATKKVQKNYAKIESFGMMKIYEKLIEFVHNSNHYKQELVQYPDNLYYGGNN